MGLGRWRIRGLVILLWVLSTQAGAGEEGAYVMKHGYHVYDAPWHLDAGLTFTEWLEEATDHQLEVRTYNNFDLHVNEDLIVYLQEHKLDSAVVSLESLAALEPKFKLFFMPFLFENSAVAHQVLDAFLLGWINEHLKPHGLVALGVLDFGFRQICTNAPNLQDLTDLSRLTLATQRRETFVEAMGKLGVKLKIIPYDDLYKVLALGVVDGAEQILSVMVAKQLHRVQKHLYLTNHFFEFMPMVFRLDFLESLPPQLQAALKQTVLQAQELNRRMCTQHEQEYVQFLREMGMTVHELPFAVFKSKIDAAYEDLGDQMGGEEMWQILFEISRARYYLEDQRNISP